jgi:lipopolysaccharide biosynthesis glycosyltransferase
LKKAIYLDCDVVVIGDIAELWNCPAENWSILAVEEVKSLIKFLRSDHKKISLPEDRPYFNSGVMVMNLEKLRQLASIEICQKIIEENHDRLLFADQDVLNIALQGTWKAISPKFNALFWTIEKKYLRKELFMAHFDAQDFKERPVIIHYTDRPKPWDYGCVDPRRKYYKQYLKLTPFKNIRNYKPTLKERYRYLRRSFHLWRTAAFIKNY